MTNNDTGKSTTYNLNGPNARINNRSIDRSINTVNIHPNPEVSKQLSLLRIEVEQADVLSKDGKSHIEVVNEIENQFSLVSPNKVVTKALIKSLPTVGNVASIASLLLALLG